MKKLCAIIFFIFFTNKASAVDLQHFNSDPKNYNVKLQIFAHEKKIGEFLVAIVNTPEKMQYGLMNLEHLDSGNGMLFIFDNSQIINMWMKNTLIPLDMIFIDQNNQIINIKNHAKPLSLQVIPSIKPAKKVLEINANLSKKLGIQVGQKIVYENFWD